MADHLQDQIMAALQATLVAANTAAGANVYIDGVDTKPSTVTNWIDIEAGGEEVESVTVGFPPNQLRVFAIAVKVGVVRGTAWRVAAGTLAKQAEQAIAATASTFNAGGLASGGIRYQGSTPEKDGTAEAVVYVITQTWLARYRCLANAPDAPL